MIIEKIAQSTKVNSEYIAYLTRSASHRYKNYPIQKKKGGMRWIAHPSRELKFLQRWLVRNIISRLPVHPAALGYQKGLSIRTVAEAHKDQRYLLLLDLRNFFESIRYEDVCDFLRDCRQMMELQLGDIDCEIVGRILTRFGAVPIGAPSSPILSNAIMFDFDQLVSQICAERDVIYSRYADDLQFSTNERGRLGPLLETIRDVVRASRRPRLEINEDKTVFTSKKHKRMVVGLTLTSTNDISVGRVKKRMIKSMTFRYQQGRLNSDEFLYLAGYIAFLRSIEPSFVDTLRRKYGDDVMQRLGVGAP